jgi:stage II sporulation protein AB (anti-sigma F factor)
VKNEMRLTLVSIPSNVAVARIAVATFAASQGFSVAEIEEIKVAVSEAVSNSVLHAYPDGTGEVTVRAIHEENESGRGELVVEVMDHGTGIGDIAKAKEPGYSTIPEHMGLGFSFMESFMDSLFLESQPEKGTLVRMVKRQCRQ